MKIFFTLCLSSLLLFTITPASAKKHYGYNYCDEPGYHCITVKRGDRWSKLFPDEYQRQVVKRLNRMNTRLRWGMKLAIPDNLANTDLMDIAPFPYRVQAAEQKFVVVDPNVLAWGAYDPYGNLIHWGPISGGRNYCSDIGKPCKTIIGKYNMFRKEGAGCESSTFPVGTGGAPMPYCMFFYRGYALHASETVPGYHDSHGCVRIFGEDAKWLNEEFVEMPNESDTNKGTFVIVNPYAS